MEKKKLVIMGIISLSLFLLIVLLLISYQLSYPYFSRSFAIWDFYSNYEKITGDNLTPEILFIGPSWTMFDINATIIEDKIFKKYKKTYQIFNLGSEGKMIFYWILDLNQILLHKPTCVFILVTDTDFRDFATIDFRFHSLYKIFGYELNNGSKNLLINTSFGLNNKNYDLISSMNLFSHYYERYNLTKEMIHQLLLDNNFFIKRNNYNNFKNPEVKDDAGIKPKNLSEIEKRNRNSILFTDYYPSTDSSITNRSYNMSNYIKNMSKTDDFTLLNDRAKIVMYICKELTKNGIKVILIEAPRDPIYQTFIPGIIKDKYRRFIDSFWPNYYNFGNNYNSSQFFDNTHMNEEGRTLFSSDLADIIHKECSCAI